MAKRNFDRFVEERAKKQHEFTIYGHTFKLPASMSFEAVLKFKSLGEREKTEQVNDLEMLDIFAALLGRDTLEELQRVSNGKFDIDTASELMKWALEVYGLSKQDEDTNPKG